MIDAILHLTVLLAAVWGIFRGYQEGFSGQVAGVLGIAFGAVAAHAFGEELSLTFESQCPGLKSMVTGEFLYSLFGYGAVFGITFGIFWLLGRTLNKLMQTFRTEVLDGIAGGLFGGFKYLLALSFIYNLIGGVFPYSKVMKYAHADDGNLVEIVMLIAPGVTGSMDCEDLYHIVQLQDAKTIS